MTKISKEKRKARKESVKTSETRVAQIPVLHLLPRTLLSIQKSQQKKLRVQTLKTGIQRGLPLNAAQGKRKIKWL